MIDLLEKSAEITEGVALTPKEWLAFYRLRTVFHYFPDPQPRHVGEEEAEEIKSLQKQHNYSVGDLAFIFLRSKSTIDQVLKRL